MRRLDPLQYNARIGSGLARGQIRRVTEELVPGVPRFSASVDLLQAFSFSTIRGWIRSWRLVNLEQVTGELIEPLVLLADNEISAGSGSLTAGRSARCLLAATS